jgi:hypothetical protein
MFTYKNVCSELRNFFNSYPLFSTILPFDMFIDYGCVWILALSKFINVGGLLYSLSYYGFFLGLIMAYSNLNNKCLYTGLFIYSGSEAYNVLKHGLFQDYKYLDFYALLTALIFGYIGYSIYNKTSKT